MTEIEKSLRAALENYERDLRSAGKGVHTIDTYVGQSERFIRYLVGNYVPEPKA